MFNTDIHPTTLAGVKRLAKTIKKDSSVKYAVALDRAAMKAGFCNFAHASRSLHVLERSEIASLLGDTVPSAPSHDGELGTSLTCPTDGWVPPRMQEFGYGRRLYLDGKAVPGFSGWEVHVIAGWFVEKAKVEADARAGNAERVYDQLMKVVNEYTTDGRWAETLTNEAMHRLSEHCYLEESVILRDFSDEKYFTRFDAFGN